VDPHLVSMITFGFGVLALVGIVFQTGPLETPT
jgi:hypothetical protein